MIIDAIFLLLNLIFDEDFPMVDHHHQDVFDESIFPLEMNPIQTNRKKKEIISFQRQS